jgi:hypothetical protein
MTWVHKLLEVPIFPILMIFSIPIIAIICGSIVAIIKQRSADELKSLMIERGMSAEEIERVIKAGPDKSCKK